MYGRDSMKKAELLIRVCPSGDPLLRGYCSACRDTTFVFAFDTEKNQRLMLQAFDIHLQESHVLYCETGEPEDANLICG
jgi:hypothetical protein